MIKYKSSASVCKIPTRSLFYGDINSKSTIDFIESIEINKINGFNG